MSKKKVAALAMCGVHQEMSVLGTDGSVEAVRPVREGEDVRGNKLMRLHRTEDGLELETLYDGRASSGPAQVATPAYRDGWDRVFKQKDAVN